MNLAAALIYWAIVALWLVVLAAVARAYLRNPRTFGATRLLLVVVAIDTTRNVVENLYFGLYFGAQYGLFPGAIIGVLGNPHLLIIPKLVNVAAACFVLGLLFLRWLPLASQERSAADDAIRQKSDALAHESEERSRLFETSLDLILITNGHGKFIRVSPSSKATLGYPPEEMVGRSAAAFVHPDDIEMTRKEVRLARAGRQMRNFDTRYVHKSGHPVELAWSGVWSEIEQMYFFIGRDMTERKAAEEKIRCIAHYDQLTGLPNRFSLQDDLAKMLNEPVGADRRATTIAVLDLDLFKEINDTLGHSVGDQLLQEVAHRLIASTKGAAHVYRHGGDEFVLVLSDCGDPRTAAKVADSALQKLAEGFDINGHRLFISASAGIAIAPDHGSNTEELLSNAGLALDDAKASGGRCYRLFFAALRSSAQAKLKLDSELRRACAENEFILYFQPQMRNGAVVGAEALLRWRHPDRGVLAPGAFIEALSQSAVAPEVGRWILQTACDKAASWRAMGLPPVRIAVNLFPVQFRGDTLLKDVEVALQRSGLPADALELEITENIALHHDDEMLAPLQALRAMGVNLAFDDFGTGYASLSYLTRLPLSRLKIDRSFVGKIAEQSTSEDTAIVRSIIIMAHNLGLEVIAEGVETLAQAAFLRAQKCDEVQGFLYAQPLPLEEFERFLGSSKLPTSNSTMAVA